MDNYINQSYYADAGSLLVGNEIFTVHIHNGYGDGRHNVIIFNQKITRDNKELYELRQKYEDFRFITTIQGSLINVYNYDCLEASELKDKTKIIATPKGKYAVFYNDGDILIEKWKDYEEI